MNDTKKFLEKWMSSISLEDKIKDWLRYHIKYGTSCPYCGLPSSGAHEECRKDI